MSNKNHSGDDLEIKLQKLKNNFAARLKDIYSNIETLKSASNQNSIKNDIDGLIHISHKLAGSAGTFGFSSLSEQMKLYELKLIKIRKNVQENSVSLVESLCQEGMDIIHATLKG